MAAPAILIPVLNNVLKAAFIPGIFWVLGNFPPKSYSSPPPNAAAKLGDLSLFSAETINSPIYHGNFLLTDNKHRKFFVIKQSKGANLCQKNAPNAFGGRATPGPAVHGSYALKQQCGPGAYFYGERRKWPAYNERE